MCIRTRPVFYIEKKSRKKISDPISWSYVTTNALSKNRLIDRTTSLYSLCIYICNKIEYKLEYLKILLKVIGWHNISRFACNIRTIIQCAHHLVGNSEVVRFVNGLSSRLSEEYCNVTSKNVLSDLTVVVSGNLIQNSDRACNGFLFRLTLVTMDRRRSQNKWFCFGNF